MFSIRSRRCSQSGSCSSRCSVVPASGRGGARPLRVALVGGAFASAVMLGFGCLFLRPAQVQAAPHRASALAVHVERSGVASLRPETAKHDVGRREPSPVCVAALDASQLAELVPASSPGVLPGAKAPAVQNAVAADAEVRGALMAAVAAADSGPAVAAPPIRQAPPRIASHQPVRRAMLEVVEGTAVDFGVRVTDPNPDEQLVYAWFLDGRLASRRPRWRFVAPLAAAGTAHAVEVQVTDAAGLKAPRVSWKLEVLPRMSDGNVREWLGRLASAWERKDIATLRLYGIVTSDAEASTLRKQLSRKGHRVSIGNETIRTVGKYASVAFDQTESDADGEVVSSRRESYQLEKQPSGFIALRAR